MTTEKTVFFQRVEALCHERDMNVSDLETAAGIGAGTIPGWRKGSVPQLKTLVKLSEFFGVAKAYLEGKTDDPIDYKNMDTSDFNQTTYSHILKKCKGNAEQANREYIEFEKAQAQDAISDPDRFAIYQNNGVQRVLSNQETEMLSIFAGLDEIQRAKVLVYAEGLQNNTNRIFRAAKSTDNTPPQILDVSSDRIRKLEEAEEADEI